MLFYFYRSSFISTVHHISKKNIHFVHSLLILCLYLSMSNKQKQEIMPIESVYNAKIKVTTPEGFTFKTEVGFLSFGRESFMNAVKFRFLNCSVVFTKIWCEDSIDRNDPNYIEY